MGSCATPPQPLSSQADLAILSTKMDTLHQHLKDVRETQNRMADAINTLAVVEEKQSATVDAVERAFKMIEKYETKQDKLEERVRTLETQAPVTQKTNKWVESAVLGIVVVAAMFVAKATGLG